METDEPLIEKRLFGPPGTGKTTFLAREIGNLADKYGADNILVSSYTKTAATELVSRKIPIPRDSVGTLHSLCYRALDSPTIAETKIPEFNQEYPQFALTPDSKSTMDECAADAVYSTDGDKLFAEYRLHRARLQPLGTLQPQVYKFAKAWEHWKLQNRYMDFTDMISFTLLFKSPPPGGKQVGVYDEVQDFNALELALIRMWANHQQYVILGGDDDQCLYFFTGASSDAFLNPPVPASQKRVLSQSWRVPRKIQAMANTWIKQIAKREPKEYRPRDFEGEVRTVRAQYLTPTQAIDDAQQYLKIGKSVMFLTSCGYMLNGFKQALRHNGIPFHNPFRKNRGDWNPLGSFGPKREGYSTAKDRLLAFLDDSGPVLAGKAYWTIKDLSLWADIVNAKGNLKRGAKTKIANEDEFPTKYSPLEIADFHHECFEGHMLNAALARDLQWLQRNLMPAKASTLEFPIKVYQKQGRDALVTKPQIIISTIHGVKGGEADVVYLFSDLSVQGMREWKSSGEGHDSIVRMMYVGMTRAKESLILCDPSTPAHVKMVA